MRDRVRAAVAVLTPWLALVAVVVIESGKRWIK